MKICAVPSTAAARNRLLAKRAELVNRHRAEAGALAGGERISEFDQARALHDEFVSLRIGRMLYREMKRIDAALARLATGDYGICLDCGNAIPARRLEAIPWAERCVACEERAQAEPERDELTDWAA